MNKHIEDNPKSKKEILEIQGKGLAIIEEVDSAILLIKKGMIEIIGINSIKISSFYHIPILLLSNGFERLLKCILLFNYFKINGLFPNQLNFFKNYSHGHGLTSMLNEIIEIGKRSKTMMSIPLSKKEIELIQNDPNVNLFFKILTNYAIKGRYYHIDVITIHDNSNENPIKMFISLRDKLYSDLGFPVDKYYDYLNELNKHQIYLIAKTTIGLCRFFTHADFGNISARHLGSIIDFTSCIDDEDIFKMKYLVIK